MSKVQNYMLNNITIKNYRNLESIDTTISNGINNIIAPNASGKTNFLESIHYTIFSSTFKKININSELIGKNDNFAKVEIKWDENRLSLIVSKSENKITR